MGIQCVVALTFLLATVSSAYSQDFVEPIQAGTALSQEQSKQLELIKSLPSTESVRIVNINPEKLRNGADVSILLSDSSVLSLSSTIDIAKAEPNFVWTGEAQTGLAMGGGEDADATVSVQGREVSAVIRTSEGVYRIQPLPGGLHALVKVNLKGLPPEHPPEDAKPANDLRDINPKELRGENDDTVAIIDLLLLFTPAAAHAAGGVDTVAANLVTDANKSLSNSGIRAEFRLAAAQIVDYQESGSQETDLDRLVDPHDGYMDEIHAVRDKVKADIVILLSDDKQYCGLSKEIFASAATAFATVYWECAVDNLSMAHEIGHVLGACHNQEVNSTCSPFPYGHGFILPSDGVRTVMAYQCPSGNCVRVPQWSRPPAWGNATLNDDARVLDQTSLRASRFR